MSTELSVVEKQTAVAPPVVITSEQIEIIKNTIAKGATEAELLLFFYDCRRRGVHPMDKLIHFTKRKDKYTPVTSIDFFRSRAGSTGEHVGTEDAIFSGALGDADFAATVTVYRRVQGEKCPFTATARFVEYMPDAGNEFMWRKMPYGQLAKCAEALALRKGFPQELADLHTFEELDRPDAAPTPPKQVQRASASGKQSAPVVAPTGVLVTEPRKVKDLRVAEDRSKKTFYVLLLDGDTNEYTTRDMVQANELEKFKGTDHYVRVSYKTNDYQGKTYYNIQNFAIADADVPLTPPDLLTSELPDK